MKKGQNFALQMFRVRVCTPEDLISQDLTSQLPDEILVHILSFLSVKEAADTSLISKRWLNLWTYISRLDFDVAQPLEGIDRNSKPLKRHMKKYVRWVNHTLERCKVERLDQFRVHFELNKSSQHDIDKWLEFAFARQVQRLELNLLDSWDLTRCYDHCYTFPAQLLGLSNDFKSVKVLLLKSVNVTGETLEFFLHNCPFLEEMVVRGSASLVNMEVVGPSIKLKHLEIWRCINLKSLKISDTNLVSLRISLGETLLLSNVPMLVEVVFTCFSFRHILEEVLPWFSCVLSQLEVLEIHSHYGSDYLTNYKFPELTKLKKFTSVVKAYVDMSLSGYTDVIEAAPQLQEFQLRLLWLGQKEEKVVYRKVVGFPHHTLKVLRLFGYQDCVGVLEFIRYFSKYAIALEKIIVEPRGHFISTDLPWNEVIEKAQSVRNETKVQLEAEVPPHIELVIL